jgi:hypothetical protein
LKQRACPHIFEIPISGLIPGSRDYGFSIPKSRDCESGPGLQSLEAAYLHIRALRHIRKRVPENVAASIASSVVGARLDYCSLVLYGVAKGKIHKLQRVQNTFACIVTGTNKFDDIKLILARLHWQPVASRIDYKIALLTFKAVTSKQPEYLSQLVHFNIPTRQLRSSSKNLLQASACQTVFATRAFFHAAPAI